MALVLVINVQRLLQNRSLAQLMKLRLHISTCSPLVQGHYLAVNDRFIWLRPKRLCNSGISEVEVIVVSGSEMHLAARLDGQCPVPVQLKFICPVASLWQSLSLEK